ncbi:MAG: CPBP family intramembrane glutamic endopeptidase [Acidobacteriaceae bacterium]|jgi:membrane protease YdiL (CAAX protease family)
MASGNTATSEPESAVAADRKRRDVVELCVGYVLILIVIWTPRPWQQRTYFATAIFIVAATWLAFPGWKAMGFHFANLARSSWIVGTALLASALAVLVARLAHTLHAPDGPVQFLERYAGYIVFAFVQQALLQDFFLLRLLRLMRSPRSAALVAAIVFSLAHLPNPILVVVTFACGLAACLLFLRYRSLYTLAVAHAILGITLAMTIPGPVIRNMRVGLGYLTYSSHQIHHRNH